MPGQLNQRQFTTSRKNHVDNVGTETTVAELTIAIWACKPDQYRPETCPIWLFYVHFLKGLTNLCEVKNYLSELLNIATKLLVCRSFIVIIGECAWELHKLIPPSSFHYRTK